MRALLLPLVDRSVAVDITLAAEVVAAPRLNALPLAPTVVLGVFSRRGDLIPVLDTAALLGYRHIGSQKASHVLVVQCGAEEAALAACDRLTVVELDGVPQPAESVGVLGIYRLDDDPIALIDPPALLARAGLVLP